MIAEESLADRRGEPMGFVRLPRTGLGRESLSKALSTGAHPRYETVKAVLRALGVKFTVVVDHPQPR